MDAVDKENIKQEQTAQKEWQKERKIKCLVWDLDNTLWNGILMEDEDIEVRDGVVEVIKVLDSRGILQSIASRNNHDEAMEKLKEFGLHEFFIYPQVNWGPKSSSLSAIADAINIGLDTIAFIDDQQFELDEVAHIHLDVLCINAEELTRVLEMPEMMPRFITDDSRRRRKMYLAAMERKKVEENFEGPQDDFLFSLGMHLTIAPAREDDLQRAEELTLRTNQLNTTGRTYAYEELDEFRTSERYDLVVADLKDKYGEYGKIGLALIEKSENKWLIRLLLMSCRVMNRGVGAVLINHIRNQAREADVRLMAEMVPNNRNRLMYMTYKFNHFQEKEQLKGVTILENDLNKKQVFPGYFKLTLS